MKPLLLATTVLVLCLPLACDRSTSSCSSDLDCKGDRICQDGRCIDAVATVTPPPKPDAPEPAAPAARVADPEPTSEAPKPDAAARTDADALRPSDLPSLCRKVDACGCPEAPDIDGCVAKLDGLASVPSSVVACIGAQSCTDLCAGKGESCIDTWYAEASAQSKAAHDARMSIIDNYPSGSPCASGYRMSGGVCVRR